MELEGEIDPEIAQRHQAVFNDLLNEIDGLTSDEDDDPQPKQPVSKPKQTAPVKKIKDVPKDDFDFGLGKNDGADAFAELEKGLKMKNEIEDLENELNALESDEEDEDHSGPKHNVPQPTVKKNEPKQPVETNNPPKKQLLEPSKPNQSSMSHSNESQGKTSSTVNTSNASSKNLGGSAKTVSLPFPLKHFVGSDVKHLIAIDNQYHGKDNMKTLALINHEINEVIDPCLASSHVSEEMKGHLEAKKKSLELFKANLTKLSQSGKLNGKTYIPLIDQMKTANLKTVKELQAQNLTQEVERVKKRLQAVVNEEKDVQNNPSAALSGSTQAKSTSSTGSTKNAQPKQPTLADSIQSPKKEDKEFSISSSEIDKLSDEELGQLLQKRKDQYWNLANYINKEMIKNLDKAEADQRKQDLQNKIIPLIQKAAKFLAAIENGEDVSELKSFLKKELVEVTPSVLHGKSWEQRSQQMENLIQVIQKCIDEESAYTEKLRAMGDGNDKKVKEGEAIIKKYNEYIDYIKKLNNENVKWIPIPKITLAKDQRTIQLVNRDVQGNSLVVKFKQLHNITPRGYWIRWGVDTINGYVTYDTPYCDASSLQFNYQQIVQLTNKEKIDPSIESKGIKVEIFFKKLFMQHKKCEGTIPFAAFRKLNTIDEKFKLRDDGIELSVLLKVREPLLKYSKQEITMIQAFNIFQEFKRDAPVAKQPANTSQSTGTKPAPKEETKKEEPKPSAGGAGGLFEKKKYPPLVLLAQQNDPLKSVPVSEYPPGITQEYVMDPANPDIIDCLGVLKKMAEELEKARPMLAAEGRRADNKVVSENWTKSLKKATILENKFGEGEIDPNQYVEILKASIERDKKLLVFYKGKGDQERLTFTAEKLRITMSDLKELEEALAAQGDEEES